MVLPKAENKEQDFDGILRRGIPFGNDKTSKTCPMDDSTEKRVPDKDDASTSTLDHKRKRFANASNSSNSSNSGVDSYNADCSGGSDDQSSDDTSGKKNLKNAILINVGSVRNSGKYSGSAGSSCSSNGGNSEAASKLCSKAHDRSSFWNEATELEKNAFPSSNETNASFPQKSGPLSNIDPIDPRIDLSIVNSIPSSAFLLPLHATARSALLQCNASPSKESDRKNIRSSILSSDGYHHLLEVTQEIRLVLRLIQNASLLTLFFSWFDSPSSPWFRLFVLSFKHRESHRPTNTSRKGLSPRQRIPRQRDLPHSSRQLMIVENLPPISRIELPQRIILLVWTSHHLMIILPWQC